MNGSLLEYNIAPGEVEAFSTMRDPNKVTDYFRKAS